MVVITSIGMGVFLMIITMALVNGMNYQMIDNTISTSLGHISIHRKGFIENIKPSFSFTPPAGIHERITGVDRVAGAAPRIKIQGMIRSSEASQGVVVTGIDPEREKSVSNLESYMSGSEGEGYPDNSDGDWIIISAQTAEKLDLVPGDRLVIMFQDASDQIVGEAFYLRGLFVSPVDTFDKFTVFTGIRKLQSVASMGNAISEISIRTETRDDSIDVCSLISGYVHGDDIETLTWQQMAPSIMSAIRLYDAMMLIFFGIIFITVIFSVANTMIMAIMERFHEIGVMKCIGTRPLYIFIMITAESVNLGLAGMVSGLAASLSVTGILFYTGMDLSVFSESMRIWGTGSIIYPLVMLKDIISSMGIVLLTAIISSLYPALKAARIKPMEALNFI